jgi:hypothetical protein
MFRQWNDRTILHRVVVVFEQPIGSRLRQALRGNGLQSKCSRIIPPGSKKISVGCVTKIQDLTGYLEMSVTQSQ